MSATVVSPIGSEALDGACPAGVARRTLRDITVANALFGGRAAAAFGLDLVLAGPTTSRTLTLLDLGAGSGDIASFLARRGGRYGVRLRPVALDRHRVAAQLCRDAGLPSVAADAWALPFADRSVDIVLASQVLHHFSRDAGARLLSVLARTARVGVVVADLHRARVAALGIWLASCALRFHPVTRRDGVTSVRRGFTQNELQALLLA
ncbi:MAG: methyltransferase domain-containing protein, partial [Gemmatimonadetes bacterium]|nr:methyltransferase domain-containing protein [Gemmatimonadota bacterium]